MMPGISSILIHCYNTELLLLQVLYECAGCLKTIHDKRVCINNL